MPLPIVADATLAQSTYGSVVSQFGTETTSNTTASSATTLSPPGFYFVVCGAHNAVKYTPNGGSTYRTLVAASAAGLVFSDGLTVEIANDVTGGTSAYYTQILGGTA